MPNFVKIEPKKVENIHIQYGDREIVIPLIGSLPISKIMSLKTNEAMIEFVLSYIGDDSDIPSDDLKAIIEAWKDASEQARNGGAPLPK